jgi:hypothetical protein
MTAHMNYSTRLLFHGFTGPAVEPNGDGAFPGGSNKVGVNPCHHSLLLGDDFPKIFSFVSVLS